MNKLTRRRFLAVSSAAAFGAAYFDIPQFLHAADAKKDAYSGFPMGAQSYSLRNFDTVEAIRHLQGMGLHYVEFYGKHLSPEANDSQIAETKQLLKNAGVTMSAHGVNGFSKDHAANRKVFEFAKRAGLPTITANPQPDSFDSLDKLVEEFQIRIAIHNHGPDSLYDSIESVTSAIKDHHQLIGACVDTGHFLRSKQDPVKAVHELKGRVYGVHVKDVAELQKRTKNVVLGTGHLDLVALFQALKDGKFPAAGALSLEYEDNPQNPIDDMKQCLAVAREAIAKVAS